MWRVDPTRYSNGYHPVSEDGPVTDADLALQILGNVCRWGEYVEAEFDYVVIDASKIDVTPEQKHLILRLMAEAAVDDG